MNWRHWLKPLPLIAALLLSTACGQSDSQPRAAEKSAKKAVQLSVLNYTDDYIDEVYVNRSWAANQMPHSGGGRFAGFAELPSRWDPNHKLTVRWRDEPLYHKDPNAFHQREVATEPYQQDDRGRMTFLWIAFFPDGVIKLYPTWVAPGHPDFPEGLLLPKLQCRLQHPDSDWCENSGRLLREKTRQAMEAAKEVTP